MHLTGSVGLLTREYVHAEVNRDFAQASIALLREVCALGTRHIVGVGTCIEYAPSTSPMKEGVTPLRPTSLYATSKNDVRSALEADADRGGCTFAWARIFYPYGVGEHPRRLCSSIATSLVEGREVVLNTPASIKDYIHVDDIASALLAVTEGDQSGAINVGTGHGVAVRDIARMMAEHIGRDDLVKDSPSPAPDEYPYIVADTTRLRSLGWAPQIPLREGLAQLIHHSRERTTAGGFSLHPGLQRRSVLRRDMCLRAPSDLPRLGVGHRGELLD